MILLDVNALVYAHRTDTTEHEQVRRWLDGVLAGDSAFGLADLVLSGFVRVVTHPRAFTEPSPLDVALEFVNRLRGHRHSVDIRPGGRHWEIFTSLCERTKPTGNRVPDAFLAALAIESGSEWITTDRGFGRYPTLRWRSPLD